MPGYDGRGPAGDGPMTGRGNGFCLLQKVKEGKSDRMVGYAGRSGLLVDVSLPEYNQEEKTMPRGDGTGPAGMGPMTGRGAGYCAGYSVPGYMNPGPRGGAGGRGGRGAGRGGGRGRRNWYRATGMPGWARAARGMPAWGGPAPAGYGSAPAGAAPAQSGPSAEQELAGLRDQAEYLEGALSEVRERIEQLQKEMEKQD